MVVKSKGHLRILEKSRLVKYYSIWPDSIVPLATFITKNCPGWGIRLNMVVMVLVFITSPKCSEKLRILEISEKLANHLAEIYSTKMKVIQFTAWIVKDVYRWLLYFWDHFWIYLKLTAWPWNPQGPHMEFNLPTIHFQVFSLLGSGEGFGLSLLPGCQWQTEGL